ncbi:uncharacterized protein LOC117625083 [Prunus dulcis]|uniref:uncharacterized protein LOC117625083 n=1 Tax=Prunus dulcis TaxID=3755 RepID=UPI001482F2C8|nr:uncharacterized protein LOC117625083 [Prunus dulcis]
MHAWILSQRLYLYPERHHEHYIYHTIPHRPPSPPPPPPSPFPLIDIVLQEVWWLCEGVLCCCQHITHLRKMDQGTATVLLFLVVVAIIFFLPLAMGPVHPPSFPVLLIFPVVLGAIWAFLNHATK